jgi:transposase
MLTQLHPGYSRAVPALTSSRQLQAARALVDDDSGVRAELLRDALARVAELESAAKALERQIEALVKASRTSLTDIVGVAAITAARILAELCDVGRVSNRGAIGALTGRKDAMRCLKRHLARVVYRHLVADQTGAVLT